MPLCFCWCLDLANCAKEGISCTNCVSPGVSQLSDLHSPPLISLSQPLNCNHHALTCGWCSQRCASQPRAPGVLCQRSTAVTPLPSGIHSPGAGTDPATLLLPCRQQAPPHIALNFNLLHVQDLLQSPWKSHHKTGAVFLMSYDSLQVSNAH